MVDDFAVIMANFFKLKLMVAMGESERLVVMVWVYWVEGDGGIFCVLMM